MKNFNLLVSVLIMFLLCDNLFLTCKQIILCSDNLQWKGRQYQDIILHKNIDQGYRKEWKKKIIYIS